MKENKSLAVFENKNIRKIWHKEEWWFSIVDVVNALTGSPEPRRYWSDLKIKIVNEIGFELYVIIVQLKLLASDGKKYLTDCSNTEGLFRIIQSIPSKKAEPFKLWLAKVGYERIQEIEDPELAQNRARSYFELKDYPKEWIEKRLRGIVIRQDLTNEWDQRDVKKDKEYSILTNEISKATFNKTIKEYKKFKGLHNPKENIRNNMTDWELILTMVGEKATTDITIAKDSKGFSECKNSAISGGEIAGNTRKEIEEKTGKSLVSKKNYFNIKNTKKIIKKSD